MRCVRLFRLRVGRHQAVARTQRELISSAAKVAISSWGFQLKRPILLLMVMLFEFANSMGNIARADEPSPFTITAENSPTLILKQTGSPGIQAKIWHIFGNDQQFVIRDESFLCQPVIINAGIGMNSALEIEANGFVGFGTPNALDNLHAVSGSRTSLRLEQDESSGHQAQSFVIQSSDEGLEIIDATNGRTPFTIEPEAFSDSLVIKANGIIGMFGNVGIGTVQPQKIGGTTLSGDARYLNLNTSTGLGRAIVQGQVGAESYLVHNGGLAGRKVVRTRVAGGKYLISTMSDNLVLNTEIPFCIDLATKNVGIKTASPTRPLQVGDAGANDGNGAHVTPGGVWTDASSRTLKDDIQPITSEQARDTVRALQPVGYRYKNEPKEQYVGFIAEDVPDLVATNDRKSLASMDITAVLTRVVQDQDRQLVDQSKQLVEERQRNDKLERLVESLVQRVTDLEQRDDGAALTK